MLVNENRPALCSITVRESDNPGLGTAWAGVQYIPGNESVPYGREKRPFLSSVLQCYLMNAAFAGSLAVTTSG